MPSYDLIQSVTRSLDILEAVARSDDGLTLQELAKELGVGPSTAHNLARTLVARRYLEKVNRPTRYRLGVAPFEVVDQQRNRALLQRASTALRALTGQYPEATAVFAEALGGGVVTVLRMSPDRPGFLQQMRGQALGPYVSASSLAYQAFTTPEECAAYRQRFPFWEFGAHYWTTEDRLDAFLREARERGYALPPGRDTTPFRIAVPVFTPSGQFVASLGLSFASADNPHDEKAVIARVVDTAQTVSDIRPGSSSPPEYGDIT